jgi:adenylyltransferase/sulfurtransferase
VQEINPLIEVRRPRGAARLQQRDGDLREYDLIVDGTDNFATRYMVNDAAFLLGKPYVWGSIYRFDGQASVFWPTAPGGSSPCYRCLYPEPPPPGNGAQLRRGRGAGCAVRQHRFHPGQRAIKLLTGIGDPIAGKLMIYDALEMEYRKLRVRKDPDCALCGDNATVTELIDYDAFCGAVSDEAAEAAVGSTISVTQLEHMLKERENGERDFVLVDVREPNEAEINHIPGAVLIPKGEFLNGNALSQLPSDKQIVMHCKSGVRSAETLAIVKGPATPTPCTWAAAWWPGSARSTPASRPTRNFPSTTRRNPRGLRLVGTSDEPSPTRVRGADRKKTACAPPALCSPSRRAARSRPPSPRLLL